MLTVLEIDGHGRREPACDGTLHPYAATRTAWPGSSDPRCTSGGPKVPAPDALRQLVARRAITLEPAADPALVVVQFARCLLRGHQVVLAPAVADHLEGVWDAAVATPSDAAARSVPSAAERTAATRRLRPCPTE